MAQTPDQDFKHFCLIRAGISVDPFLRELSSREHVWLYDTRRQDQLRTQRHTNSIFLRSLVEHPGLGADDTHSSQLTVLAPMFPVAVGFVELIAKKLGGELSRAQIVRLQPKSRVGRHIDKGEYYRYRDRFHLVLHSAAGSVLIAGDEQVRMQAGELWWFDNKVPHEAYNESDEWRTHLIFDVLPPEHAAIARDPPPVDGALH